MWMASAEEISVESFAELRGFPGSESFVPEDADGALLINDSERQSPNPAISIPLSLLFAGGTSGARGGRYLFRVGLWTPSTERDEFLSWYEKEHLPMLLECAAWGGCRFVEAPSPEGCQFYALHQLVEKSALESNERRASRATPWFYKLKRHDWFDAGFTRQLYVRTEGGTQ